MGQTIGCKNIILMNGIAKFRDDTHSFDFEYQVEDEFGITANALVTVQMTGGNNGLT